MADGIIAHPFRYTTAGELVSIPDGSDDEIHQLIATTVLTRMGERLLNPLYGIPDPAFAGLDIADVQAGLNTFGPPSIQVTELANEAHGPDTAIVHIGWERED